MAASQVVIVALAVAAAAAQMSGVANADTSAFVWWMAPSCSAESWVRHPLDINVDCSLCLIFPTDLYGFGVEYGGVAISVYNDVDCEEVNNRFDTTYPGVCTGYLGWKTFRFEC